MTEERIYSIPLRKAFRKPQKKRVPYAIKIVKEFLLRHTKADEVKLGDKLNQCIWEKGISKPPRKVKVKAIIDNNVAKVELMGYEYKDFKSEKPKEGVGYKEKIMQRLGAKAIKKQTEEKALEGRSEEKKGVKEINAKDKKEKNIKKKIEEKETEGKKVEKNQKEQ